MAYCHLPYREVGRRALGGGVSGAKRVRQGCFVYTSWSWSWEGGGGQWSKTRRTRRTRVFRIHELELELGGVSGAKRVGRVGQGFFVFTSWSWSLYSQLGAFDSSHF